MQYFYLASEENRSRFASAAKTAGFRIFERPLSISNIAAISLNLTHQDPVLRKLFNQKKFRIALSVAIDRNRIIQEVLNGHGEPYQVAPRPESPFFHPKLATQFTEYDPNRANALLDDLGYSRRDSSDFRLLEGKRRIRFKLTIGSHPIYSKTWQYVMESVINDWRRIGIEAIADPVDFVEIFDRNLYNRHDAVIWEGEGGLDVLQEPRYYLPISQEANYGCGWVAWYLKDPIGVAVEPPPSVTKQWEIFQQLLATPEFEQQLDLMNQILDIAADEFRVIGISLQNSGYGIVSNSMRNVPSLVLDAWSYPSPGPTNPCQYHFIKKTGK
jgi:peptide/nickel transport system substrate-binding protein